MTELQNKIIAPPKMSLTIFILKIVANSTGGLIGTLIMFLLFALFSSFLSPITDANTDIQTVTPILTLILMAITFISATSANIIAIFLSYFTERSKYKRLSQPIIHTLLLGVLVFLFLSPLYFLAANQTIEVSIYVILLHLLISVQVSSSIFENSSNHKYSMLSIYSSAITFMLSASVIFGLSKILESPALLLFIALPVILGIYGIVSGIINATYNGLVYVYDKDFLIEEYFPIQKAPQSESTENRET